MLPSLFVRPVQKSVDLPGNESVRARENHALRASFQRSNPFGELSIRWTLAPSPIGFPVHTYGIVLSCELQTTCLAQPPGLMP